MPHLIFPIAALIDSPIRWRRPGEEGEDGGIDFFAIQGDGAQCTGFGGGHWFVHAEAEGEIFTYTQRTTNWPVAAAMRKKD